MPAHETWILVFIICLNGLQYVHATSAKPPIEKLLNENEPLQLEFCQNLGYNTTPKINFLKESQHSAERNNKFTSLVELSKVGCSDVVKHFACSLFAPPSLPVYGALPPCKSLCYEVTKSCARYLRWASLLTSYSGSCKLTKRGDLFKGKTRQTRGGIPCQKWSAQSPHRHFFKPGEYPDKMLVKNYCRNPDGETDGPWCYTTSKSKRWDYCDVPMCSVHLYCDLLSDDGCIYYVYDINSDKYQLKVRGKPNQKQLKQWITQFSPKEKLEETYKISMPKFLF